MTRNPSFQLAVLLLISLALGCGKSEPTSRSDGQSTGATTAYDGLTASDVVGKMVDTYRRAKSYMDNAEYAEHFSEAKRRVPQQTPPHVTSVLLARPNRFRITRFVPAVEGPPQLVTAVCDGERLLATVSDLEPQLLDVEAPAEPTTESIAADPLLREALFPVPIENLFPQLALLLADDSPPPWPAAASDRLEMLPPLALERQGHPTVECFRVRIASPLGAYVYWIDRKSFLLHRLELPSDEVRRLHYAGRDLGSYQLIIDFFDATIDVDVPDDAFQLEVPKEAKRVKQFEAPEASDSPEAVGPELEAPAGLDSDAAADQAGTSQGE